MITKASAGGVMRAGVSFAVIVACACVASRASAGEPEAVRLIVEGPSACVSEATLRTDLAALGASFRDATEGEPARTLTVVVSGEREKHARLVVQDLAFRETSRELVRSDCAALGRTIALAVALSLDEGTPPTGEAPGGTGAPDMPSAPSVWPAPAEAPPPPPPRDPRVGGVALSGFYGGAPYGSVSGVRAVSPLVRLGRARLGIASAAWVEDGELHRQTRAIRGGAAVSFGAPWNDTVAGFTAELGAAGGRGDVGAFTSPYAAWSLVLQVPWKPPVRPFAALSGMWTPLEARRSMYATVDVGLAWQAW